MYTPPPPTWPQSGSGYLSIIPSSEKIPKLTEQLAIEYLLEITQ